MKKFDKKVRWEFKLAIEGYGRNVREALIDAARILETRAYDEWGKNDLEAIESHEIVGIEENDTRE